MDVPEIGSWRTGSRLQIAVTLLLIAVGDALGFAVASTADPTIGLTIGFTTFVGAGFTVYLSLRRSHARMTVLDRFSASLGGSVLAGDALQALLSQTYTLLGVDWAWIITTDGVTAGTLEFDGHQLRQGMAQGIDLELADKLGETTGEVLAIHVPPASQGARRVRHVLGVSLPVTTGGSVILAIGRGNRWSVFRGHEVELFSRIALHGGVAIQNVRLLEKLRSESATNRHQADHDALTGLPNRARFRSEVARALNSGDATAVIVMDLDRFKEVNDTLGHHNGDKLLADASARMRSVLGPGMVLARLGGDEFALLVRIAASEDEMLQLAERLRAEMQRPFKLGQVQADVGASIGIALGRRRGENVGDLLRRADVAMYAAKTDRTGIEVYKVALDHNSTERLEMVPRLRSAIDRREMVLYFQPQLDLRSGRVIGAETLIRWPGADVGFISPDEFLPIAERTDLIRPLTRFVLAEAVVQCARWRRDGHDLRVSVNLSARNLLEPDLADYIHELVVRANLPLGALRVELTETALLTRADDARVALERLRSIGIGVALDDFGTGHSSLSYLTTLPVDEVKIDKSFVLDLGIDPVADRVVRTIVELGNNLDLEVVAEGVETSRHADVLMQMGCTLGQGFFFARPMPPAEFEAWLAEHRRWTSTHAEPLHA